KKYKTRAEAISDIVSYIEIFYNRERIQSKPGYLSPIKYLMKYYERMKVA
ncbi:MAG: IS3 family transposase, partial [Flavobacterium piscis]|nr:IS3 family transposase [Flavobacterium piscis]